MYVALLGRFISRDPIGYEGSEANLSEYVRSQPTRSRDPMGLQAWPGHGWPPANPAPQPVAKFPRSNEDNFKNWWGFNTCRCPPSKADRAVPIPGLGTPPPSVPRGPDGGSNEHYLLPLPGAGPIGAGGCHSCIGLVILCPPNSTFSGGVAVYHFTTGDDPCGTLRRARFRPLGCLAIVCGGTEEHGSLCLAKATIGCARSEGINVVGISERSACGIWNGVWYEAN